MTPRLTISGARATITLTGKFDFHSRQPFNQALEKALASQAREVVIHLGEVSYLDSSALGLLLVTQDKAKTAGKTLLLGGVQGAVKQVLEIANFHKRFPFI